MKLIKEDADISRAFYLSGGTALAAFYLNHRESEDLDFFSEQEVEPLVVEAFLKRHRAEIKYKKIEFQKSFNRNLFFLHFDANVLKTEFTYFPFTPIEKGPKVGKLRIDSLRDIAANKAFTITQQLRARDFVDVYFICKHANYKLADLIKDARVKFDAFIDPIQFGSHLLQVGELKDWPRMKIRVTKKELQTFFANEAALLKKQVLS